MLNQKINLVEQRYQNRNRKQTLLIFGSMTLLLVFIGFVFAGVPGIVAAMLLVAFAFIFSPRMSPALLIRMYGAQLIDPYNAPELYDMANRLRLVAELDVIPEIYYLPSAVVNSFTIGDRTNYKILLSAGLLSRLNARELYGVLAHEISHVHNNDLDVMAVADVMSRVTSAMSLTGVFLLIITIPLMASGEMAFPLSGLLLLIFAPNLMTLLQLALSRTREFIADLKAVELTGDALGLASALEKIDSYERHWARQMLIPHYKLSEPSLLRTHPPSRERIKRLVEIAELNPLVNYLDHPVFPEYLKSKRILKNPRRRFHGLWY